MRRRSLVVLPGANPGDLTLDPPPVRLTGGSAAADAGTLAVPENRAKADSRLIALPVLRIRATTSQPAEPIFFLEGGPGMSNLRFNPPASLLATHDVILLGYRGVDGSVRLNCPKVSRALKRIRGDLLSADSRAAFGRAAARDARRLEAQGIDIAGHTTKRWSPTSRRRARRLATHA